MKLIAGNGRRTGPHWFHQRSNEQANRTIFVARRRRQARRHQAGIGRHERSAKSYATTASWGFLCAAQLPQKSGHRRLLPKHVCG